METSKRLVMHQVKYATEILRKFETIEYNPAVTQAETRIKTEEASDEEPVEPTMFKVGLASRFMRSPMKSRMPAAKLILIKLMGYWLLVSELAAIIDE
ncbi:transmembrane protein, putative [Medicago truncatula]|uniref:Transmembrane protein, putative n=1 Tax=Medicago truncatula TaxID=3880 RepID=A0A072VBU2_MEDTR|nr:transmembrane protein, putative [Medicago truncatula]